MVASSTNGHAGPPPRPLAEVAADVAAGRAAAEDLPASFLAATVYCEAGEAPGFLAVGPPGSGIIPVFSSEAELARARGAVAWFSTTGADLLSQVPDGYDLGLDLAGDAPLRLRPAALAAGTAIQVGWS